MLSILPKQRRNSRAKLLLLSLVIAFSFDADPTASRSPQDDQYGGTLRIGVVSTDPVTILPYYVFTELQKELSDLVFGDGLVYTDKLGKLKPGISRSFQNSEDYRRWTFELKDYVFFHDGAKLTSDDVVFSLQFYQTLRQFYVKKFGFYGVSIDNIKSVSKNGPFSVVFNLYYPDESFIEKVSDFKILSRAYYQGITFEGTKKNLEGKPPMGIGPFSHVSAIQSLLTLKAHQSYYRGRAYLDHIVFKFYNTADRLDAAFITDEVDYIEVQKETSIKKIFSTGVKQKRLVVSSEPIRNLYVLALNNSLDLFSEMKVRNAIDNAINKRDLVKRLIPKRGDPAADMADEDSWAYQGKEPRYDPKKALGLLASAGWTSAGNAGRLERNGKPFIINLIFDRNGVLSEEIARVIKLNLSEIGINVIPEALSTEDYVERLYDKDYQSALVTLPYNNAKDPNIDFIYSLYHSSRIAPGSNFSSFSSVNVNFQLNNGKATGVVKSVRPIIERIQTLLRKETPSVFLFFENKKYNVVRNRFFNVRDENDANLINPVQEWFIPARLRK